MLLLLRGHRIRLPGVLSAYCARVVEHVLEQMLRRETVLAKENKALLVYENLHIVGVKNVY